MSNEELATNILMLNLVEALHNDDQDEINKLAKPLAKRMCSDTNSKEYYEILYSLGYEEQPNEKRGFIKRLTLTRSNNN
jgi:hypothetical protein